MKYLMLVIAGVILFGCGKGGTYQAVGEWITIDGQLKDGAEVSSDDSQLVAESFIDTVEKK